MELLAPAGNFDAMTAAVQNGADAVYMGFGGFNARRSAANFDGDEFRRAVEYCHMRGVKAHVTLNTLIKEDEFDAFCAAAAEAYECGADAAIVQDLGGAQAIRAICPDMKLHMSTQAACNNAAGVRYAAAHGYDRVVLARECSLDEIRRCAKCGVEIETFVHGALCVCFSGQCLFSSMVGGRSGNRGACAQPCRLEYRLRGAAEADGYLLSPRDIMLIEDLPQLKDAGVCSLKIEGRLKRPEYVAEVTRVYRRALDMLNEHPERFEPDADDVQALRQIFNRGGFSRAYLDTGFIDSEIMCPERPNNMGAPIGRALDRSGGRLRIALDAPVDEGDQISIRTEDRHGETGFESKTHMPAGEAVIDIPQGGRELIGIEHAALYRTASDAQLRRAAESVRTEHRATNVDMRVRLMTGEKARLTITAGEGAAADISDLSVSVEGDVVDTARKAPLTADSVRTQLQKTGGTPLQPNIIEIELSDDAFLPVAALNALRREAVDAFIMEMLNRRGGKRTPLRELTMADSADEWRNRSASTPRIVLRPQVSDAMASGDDDDTQSSRRNVLIPYSGDAWGGYGESSPRIAVQCADIESTYDCDIIYWTPQRIDGEYIISQLGAIGNHTADVYLRIPNMLTGEELSGLHATAKALKDVLAGVLLTNIGQLHYDWPADVVADFNLNAWNTHSILSLAKRGVVRVTAPLELTTGEIARIHTYGLARELIVYGRAELMTLRHCPVNAQSGLNHTTCHRCDTGKGADECRLIDRKDASFPLRHYRGESGCYVNIYNSLPIDVTDRLRRLPACDVARLIFTDESYETRSALISAVRSAIAGESAARLTERATAGHYFNKVD